MRTTSLSAALAAVVFAATACGEQDTALCGPDGATIDRGGSPVFVTTAGDFVYWTADGGVKRAPLAGGTVTEVARREGSSYAIAVAGEHVYFTDFQGGVVLRVPAGGGEAQTIASEDTGPYAIAADATHAFWINRELDTLRAADHASATVTTLASDLDGPLDLAVAGDDVLVADGRGVVRISTTGGPATPLSDRTGRAYKLAVADDHVYWLEDGAGLFRAPLAGGPASQLAALPVQFGGLATDGVDVWFIDGTSAAVLRVPATGGAPETLCDGLDNPIGLALGGGRLFVTDSVLGRVLARPQ